MGSKTVKFSDLTGKVVEDEAELSRLIVEQHPGYADPIPLEVLPTEVENDLKTAERYVILTYSRAGASTSERYVLDLDTFNGLAKGRSMDAVLDDALVNSRVQQRQQRAAAPEAPSGRRPGRPRTEAEGKVNYASLEHAGEPHRGRITDAEKQIVQEHFDEVNKRLSEKGLRMIDPADPKMKERYDLKS